MSLTGKRIALLVGVSEYEHQWDNLPACKTDALQLRDTLTNKLGEYTFDLVKTIAGAEATSENITAALRDLLLRNNLTKDDLFLFYFSGHGFLDREFERDKGLLIAKDTKSDPPYHNSLDMLRLRSDFFNVSSARSLFIIDSCYSGAFLTPEEELDSKQYFTKAVSCILADEKCIITSCSSDTESFTNEVEGLSRFTSFLLKGLAGDSGALTKDMTVTFESLVIYLENKLHLHKQSITRGFLLSKPLVLSKPNLTTQDNTVLVGSLDFSKYLNSTIAEYESKPPASNDSYISLTGKITRYRELQSPEHGYAKDVDEHLLTWAHEPEQLIVILGDTGTGKSTAVKRFRYNLCQSILKGNAPEHSRIPLFVELKDFNIIQNLQALIIHKLQITYKVEAYWPIIHQHLSDGKLIFILDGFDEMLMNISDETVKENITSIVEYLYHSKNKIVLTCRRHFLRTDNELVVLLKDTPFAKSGFSLLRLEPFSEQDTWRFIDRNVKDEALKKQCYALIDQTLGKDRIKERPLLLEMLVTAIPQFLDNGTEPSPYNLYSYYVNNWMERDTWRFRKFLDHFERDIRALLEAYGQDNSVQVQRDDLSKLILSNFIQLLAWNLFESRSDSISHKKLPSIIREQLPIAISSKLLDFFEYALRTCSFLTRTEDGEYSFIDKSFKDFYLATLFKREIEAQVTEGVEPRFFGRKKLNNRTADFLAAMTLSRTEQLTEWLGKSQRIKEGRNFLRYLGGNSATLLNILRNHEFSGEPFKSNNFCGANLTEAKFFNSELDGSVLDEAILSKAKLNGSNLTGCSMIDVDFNECDFTGATLVNGDTNILNPRNIASAISLPNNFESIMDKTKGKKQLEILIKPSPNLLNMVRVPAGEFLMGSDSRDDEEDEKPAHRVFLQEFWIDKFPVTNEEFYEFVRAMPEWRRDPVKEKYRNTYYLDHWVDGKPTTKMMKLPVVYVNWYAASAYALWIGKRLPTEAEWEKAIRGGKNFRYAWGNEDRPPEGTNYNQKIGFTTDVGTAPKQPNYYGIYDMFGNVKEWCADWYDPDHYKTLGSAGIATNPTGAEFTDHKVFRGGSFSSKLHELSCSFRNYLLPENSNVDQSFRCALTPSLR